MSKGFKATKKFFNACATIIRHSNCPEPTRDFIRNVSNTCSRTGYVSAKQAKCVGGTYMHVVNNGVYVEHDWWN